MGSDSGKIIMELPLVFFNQGATPIIVHSLRLHIEGGGKPLVFNAVVDKIGTDEGRRFAAQFPVRQQEAVVLICEFNAKAVVSYSKLDDIR
jgi:hypothetical protein